MRSWQSKIAFIIADFPASAEHNLCSTSNVLKSTDIWADISILWSRFLSRSRASIFLIPVFIRFIIFNILWLYMTCRDPRSKDHTFGGPISPAQKSTVFFCPMKTHWILQVDVDWCRKPCSELGASNWLDLTWTKICEVLRSLTDMS